MLTFDRSMYLSALIACVAATSQLTACGGDDSPAPASSTPAASTPAPTPTTPAPTPAPTTPAPAPAPTTPATPAAPTPAAPVPTPAAPAPAPTPAPAPAPTAGGDCNITGNIFTIAGITAQLDSNIYDPTGQTILQKQQAKYTIRSGASFRSESGLTEVNQDTATSFTTAPANGVTAGTTVLANVKSYSKVVGNDSSFSGVLITSSTAGFSTVATIYLTPALLLPTNPALNTPYARTYTSTVETFGFSQPSTQTLTTTYLGVETVSVPAGTFAACKTKTDTVVTGVAPVTSFSWTVASGRLKGHILKTANANNVTQTEATVLLVNGQ